MKSLDVKYEWSGDLSSAKVGEPLTLTLETTAIGATSTQLPEIPVPDVTGLKIYVDNPEFGSRPDATGLLSVRRDKWSVIPNQGGQLTLPEVVVKWWDTEADVEKRAVVPAQQLTVGGSPAASQAAIANSQGEQQNTASVQTDSVTPEASQEQDNAILAASDGQTNEVRESAFSARGNNSDEFVPRYWLWIAVGALTLWLATLCAWWLLKVRGNTDAKSDKVPHSSSERSAFKKMQALAKNRAATSSDTSAYCSAVLEWAHSRWPQNPVHNLPDIGIRLGDKALVADMRRLDQQRYSDQSARASVSINEIQKALEDALQHETADRASQKPLALPQL